MNRNKLGRIIARAMLLLTLESPVFAREATFFVLGTTFGGRSGAAPRAGVDASLLSGKCRDYCSGFGPTVGIINPRTKEYFAGLAMGAAYFGTFWADAAMRFKEGRPTALHVTYGMGFALMAYVGGGIDMEKALPFGEVGITFKLPLTQ